jgi:hypothetical protein
MQFCISSVFASIPLKKCLKQNNNILRSTKHEYASVEVNHRSKMSLNLCIYSNPLWQSFIKLNIQMYYVIFTLFTVTVNIKQKFTKSHDMIMEDHMEAKGTCTIQIP